MRPIHPFQKHFCVLFLSIALLATFITLKKRHMPSSDAFSANYTDDFLAYVHSNTSLAQRYFTLENDISRMNLSRARNVIDERRVVYILGLFELTTKWGRRYEGESEMSAAKLAVDHVNALNVLPGYSLELLVNDTECDPGVGIDRFFHALYSNKTILMLLGAGCSNVSERLAHVVPFWNIIQVSFGSTSPSLSDRNKFPLFFRTVAPDTSHNSAKIHFVKEFGWEVVATFSQSENEYLLPVNHLVTELEKVNVTCISMVTFSLDNYKEQLRVLKHSDRPDVPRKRIVRRTTTRKGALLSPSGVPDLNCVFGL
ncbi:gamma-aminobutyric acid type B receptor subunit 1-like [Anoplophora glabripennis]|uniref:gamma-aminobutyric acid type B receptor subunit 1-like n=1 Tax=Anoplophora glabripennis TaxID=217634 RepID=UPI000874831B|nr:gamma-aminobutyric acid type B receptor subunit 1-like [Anoplophora glabripennis]